MGFCCGSTSKKTEDIGHRGNKAAGVSTIVRKIDDAALEVLSTNNILKQVLLLTIKCIDLPNMDKKSKTDSFCIMFMHKDNKKIKVGQTEIINDSLNPNFI